MTDAGTYYEWQMLLLTKNYYLGFLYLLINLSYWNKWLELIH